ncbi:MAG: Ig-like domain-containing protein, partial [Conchiformibius sp.]|nr:Ig-like domain-containing protein [Conchiformibius sp.]
ATVTGNRWQTSIAGSKLAQNQGANSIIVQVQVTDKAGNSADSSQTASYQVDTLAPTAQITLNPIAENGILEDGERTQMHTLSGTVSGEFNAGSTVMLDINGQSLQTTVQENGHFQVQVSGEQLAASGSREVKAQMNLRDDAGNTGKAEAAVTYQVEDAPVTPPTPPAPPAPKPEPARIQLDPFDPAADQPQHVRISGRLDLQGDFLIGQNKSRVYALTVHIGDKSYTTHIDRSDQSFVLAVPEADLSALNGQTVRYSFDKAGVLYKLNTANGGHEITTVRTPELNAKNVVLDADSPIQNNVFRAVLPENRVNISGKVSGEGVQAGDNVVVEIGSERVETQVRDDLSFSVQADRKALAGSHAVHAKLLKQDATAAETEAVFAQAPADGNGDFVSAHRHQDFRSDSVAYFLKGLMNFADRNPPPLYHDYRFPFGSDKTAEVRYRFLQDSSRGLLAISEANREVVRKSLDIFSRYANIRFSETDDLDGTDIVYTLKHLGAKTFGYASGGGGVQLGTAIIHQGGTGNFNNYKGVQTILHETLHSFGLKHPKEAPFALPKVEDRTSLTVMSYFHDTDKHDLAIYDLAFMHYRFGVNPEARKGNDVYRFKPVNPEQTDLDIYLWDGGGVDTFDASDQIQGVNVNLTPGSWIYAGKKAENFVIDAANGFTSQSFFGLSDTTRTTGGIVDAMSEKHKYTHNQAFIGYGTQIENLIGSAYDDVLTGNNAANTIQGGSGNDTLNGGGGNDYLDGGAGADTMRGGTGDDVYVVNQQDDSVSENANEGKDSVYSYINYTLGEHVENLYLYGAAHTATGNAADNVLVGNAADNRLEGKGGSDTLTGGKGRDTFVFSDLLSADTVTDFTVGEDTLALSRDVFTAINGTADILNKVSYNAQNGQLSYTDASGHSSHFATLNTGLSLDENSFSLI